MRKLQIAALLSAAWAVRCLYSSRSLGRVLQVSDDHRADLLAHFRRHYGRLCVLAAQSLQAGVTRDLVVEAMRGEGDDESTEQIRMQRFVVYGSLKRAREAGNPRELITKVGRETKRAVQAEWLCTLPMSGASV